MIRFIGFYDYTVILTYLSLISSVFGMTQAIHGDYKDAVFCLVLSGICDAFDGRVARTKKNRTADEKNFGIQLDSLCDVVCFGVFPALICYLLGVRGVLGLLLVFFYCTCAVIRLAYFNVLEGKRQQTEGGCTKTYRGLPVTSISLILPVMFWLQLVVSDMTFIIILHVMLLVVGFLFILDVPIPKPNLKMMVILMLVMLVSVGLIFAYSRLRLPKQDAETNPIVDELMGDFYDAETP